MENTFAVGPKIKIVIVGDELVGKTAFINNFANSQIPIARTSTVFQSIQSFVEVGKVQVPVEIWDTTGKKQYERMIKSIYEDANIVVILFSVVHCETYKNALQQWYKEITATNSKALKVFVGNKTDMRNQGVTLKSIPEKDVKLKIQQELGCKYLQCSAVTGEGVRNIFEYSVRNCMEQAFGSRKQLKKVNVVSREHARKVNDNVCCEVM